MTCLASICFRQSPKKMKLDGLECQKTTLMPKLILAPRKYWERKRMIPPNCICARAFILPSSDGITVLPVLEVFAPTLSGMSSHLMQHVRDKFSHQHLQPKLHVGAFNTVWFPASHLVSGVPVWTLSLLSALARAPLLSYRLVSLQHFGCTP